MGNNVEVKVLSNCARCGDNHYDLTFEELDHSIRVEDSETVMTHWSVCPSNGQPILLLMGGA